MYRLSGLFLFGLLVATSAHGQVADKPAVMGKPGVETEFITPAAIKRVESALIFKEKKNGVWKYNDIDDSDWTEIFARFAWVIWGQEPLPNEARQRTNARANSTRPDVMHIAWKEFDVTIIKQAFSIVISKLNDQILLKMALATQKQ